MFHTRSQVYMCLCIYKCVYATTNRHVRNHAVDVEKETRVCCHIDVSHSKIQKTDTLHRYMCLKTCVVHFATCKSTSRSNNCIVDWCCHDCIVDWCCHDRMVKCDGLMCFFFHATRLDVLQVLWMFFACVLAGYDACWSEGAYLEVCLHVLHPFAVSLQNRDVSVIWWWGHVWWWFTSSGDIQQAF